ncbi:MAG: T9SS type A sorting domain-containing protein [Chitinophagales bacterium]
MKQKLLSFMMLLGAFAFFTHHLAAQCIPNNDTVVGIEPDTLSVAYVGVPYEQIIYFKIPLDTSIQFGPYTVPILVDSLVITSYSGLPPSFSLSCNTASCTLLGGQNGCASISGTATESELGYHPLKVYVTTYVSDTLGTTIGGFPDSIDFYFLDIQLPAGIANTSSGNWEMGYLYPNPSNQKILIPVTAPINTIAELSVKDISGREIKREQVELKKGSHANWIDISSLPDGCYFIQLNAKGYHANAKFQVMH